MASAILRLFGNLSDALIARNVPAGAVQAYIFGGCAVHLHAQSRASSDVDVEFAYAPAHKKDVLLVLGELPPIDYDDPEMGESSLAYDSTFNTTLGPLHEDYRERAHLLEAVPGAPVHVWLPCAEDVALTKLGRFADVDIEDILALLMLPEAKWTTFEKLAQEVDAYYVGASLSGKLDYVRNKLQERRSL